MIKDENFKAENREHGLYRSAGILRIISSLTNILICIVVMTITWVFRPIITQDISTNLGLVNQALGSTGDVLSTVNATVQSASVDVTSFQATTDSMNQAIQDAHSMMDTMIQMTGKDLPDAITATQTSLDSGQNSAQLIDNVLGALTQLPFSPIAPYKPVVPLHTALSNISRSLDPLNPSLQKINQSLTKGGDNLENVETDLARISEKTQGITNSLGSAQTDIEQYRFTIEELQAKTQKAISGLSAVIFWVASLITFILVIIVFSQGASLVQTIASLQDNSHYNRRGI